MAGRAVLDPILEAEWKPKLLSSLEEMQADRERASASEQKWRTFVRGALAAGMTAKQIGEITGYTPSRLYQINGGRRT